MDEGEIVTMYRQAKRPEEQRKILAELNNCSVEEIDGILERQGARITKETRPQAHNKKIDDEKALKLHAQGATDAELMEAFGCTASTVSNWRGRHNLPCNRAPRPEKGAEPPVQVTVEKALEAGGPDDTVIAVRISGGRVPSEIVVRFGEGGRGEDRCGK